MLDYNFKFNTHTKNYTFYTLSNIINEKHFPLIKQVALTYPFTKVEGKRIGSQNRIWCNLTNNIYLKQLSQVFDTTQTKKVFSDICGCDFTNCRTRIELCNDTVGSYLENHVDDKAKLFTLQIYLTSLKNSTVLDGDDISATENNGWFFANTGTEYHSLSNLTNDRSSIIVNYVNDLWRDTSILVQ